ncbi:hypothetical protein B0H17DRAFT_207895 [Mycena rosella]|uniref:Uncharacterized protein n=1 Tax=Mycena rosella TaxID=1033263 RepID=A0AAD7CY03_MYCRO|nr:hypothetical protein B0H17DRAFT_207895 [Mycena rosella]
MKDTAGGGAMRGWRGTSFSPSRLLSFTRGCAGRLYYQIPCATDAPSTASAPSHVATLPTARALAPRPRRRTPRSSPTIPARPPHEARGAFGHGGRVRAIRARRGTQDAPARIGRMAEYDGAGVAVTTATVAAEGRRRRGRNGDSTSTACVCTPASRQRGAPWRCDLEGDTSRDEAGRGSGTTGTGISVCHPRAPPCARGGRRARRTQE